MILAPLFYLMPLWLPLTLLEHHDEIKHDFLYWIFFVFVLCISYGLSMIVNEISSIMNYYKFQKLKSVKEHCKVTQRFFFYYHFL